MDSKVNYMLVGLFVLVLGAALIGGVVWLLAGETRAETDMYLVYMTESVSGLTEDAPVKYKGVDVGLVQDIDLANSKQVRLLLEVLADTPITQGTHATLETQGITGFAYINLEGGEPNAPPLRAPPGLPYPVIETSPSLLGRLDATLTAMSENLIEMSTRFNALLDSENREAFARTLANLKKITTALAADPDAIESGLNDFAAAMEAVRNTSERLPELADQLETTLTSLERMSADVAAAGEALEQTVEASGSDIRRFTAQALPEAAAIMAELRQAAENLRRVSEELARDPSRLVYPAPTPELGPGE